MKVLGLDKLIKKLDKIEKKEAKKIVRKAVRKAQNIAKNKAKETSQSMVGGEMGSKIKQALKVKSLKKQKKGSYQLQVCIDPNKSEEFVHQTKGGIRYYIPTAIEYGHRKRGGGTVPAIPFMTKAAESTESKRLNILKKEIKKGLDSVK